jgi:oligopeptide/dipeptide ABC transporter ATP-binding protein
MSLQATESQTPLLSLYQVGFSYSRSAIDTRFFRRKQYETTPFALKEISFSLQRREAFGLIGESTCGKTTLGKVLQFLPAGTYEGVVEFNVNGFKGLGNVFEYARSELREYRKRVQMIFQNPDASLNPGMKVESLIGEAIQSCPKKRYTRKERIEKMKHYLQMMNLQGREASYPDILSGGEKRRVGIIRALALEPDVLIADEPFANLDVALRNHLIDNFQQLKTEKGLSFLFILHEIDVAHYLCDRVAVMYLGRIVEIGETQQLFSETSPKHPYTQTLIAAAETLKDASDEADFGWRPPQLIDTHSGCPYRKRCTRYGRLKGEERKKCEHSAPHLLQVEENHQIACHFSQKEFGM